MEVYQTACGLASYIDSTNKFKVQLRFEQSYNIYDLDDILTKFLLDESIEVNTTFAKGTKNRKNKIRYRKIRKASKNFRLFRKWLNKQ